MSKVETDYDPRKKKADEDAGTGVIVKDNNREVIDGYSAFDLNSKDARTEVIVRDSNREVIDGYSKKGMAENALMAEVLALKEGIDFVIEKKWQRIVLEIDSKEVYNVVLNKGFGMDWRIKPVVKDT
ncbi:hypothetical protein CRYUN_Cryun07bG0082000 [Craigia yunnanensis]